jgi:hypothetical protein
MVPGSRAEPAPRNDPTTDGAAPRLRDAAEHRPAATPHPEN